MREATGLVHSAMPCLDWVHVVLRPCPQVSRFDLTIRHARVATETGVDVLDIGVRGERIEALEAGLPAGHLDIDATGKLVLPGGVDTHCHIEQASSAGVMCADDFYSGTVSAAFGGTTTVVPFAAQQRGARVRDVVADYHRRAAAKAVIDYGFHLIVADPDEAHFAQDLADCVREGISSLKVYMTYERLRLQDHQILDLLLLADLHGALVMVHAENHDVIRWISERLLARGRVAPKFHVASHDAVAERDATQRIVQFARLLDVPVLIVHVSDAEAMATIRAARLLGARVHAETCPQYLLLDAADADLPGVAGAQFCCSPPARDAHSRAAAWRALADGTLQVLSSDHAPFRMDEGGKLPQGEHTTFKQVANGVPGLETRLPLLFSEGVNAGRLDLRQFVELTASNPAKLFGLYPRKGVIALGADADLAVWDEQREVTIHASALHDRAGYTPYEGRQLRGWPETVISRGRIVVQAGQLCVAAGSGRFIARGRPGALERRAPMPEATRRFRALVD